MMLATVIPVKDDDDIEDNNNDTGLDEVPPIQDMMIAMDQELQDHRGMEQDLESLNPTPALNAEESSNVQKYKY